jgi:putative Mg2+ transporter-C (MgtC) family protein
MLGWTDILLRLGAAMLIGGVVGLNRELHHKPTGLRTLSLVSLGSALTVLAVAQDPQADISRAIQGVITGVGFLGAGVILHPSTGGDQVHGLTTAAVIWVTAAMGVLCGVGAWSILAIAVPLLLAVLLFGGPVEKWCHKILGSDDEPPLPKGPP